MEALIDGLNSHILPYIRNNADRLIRKHKTSISASITLLALYLAYERFTKPPRKLRHLPQASYWGVIHAQLTKKPVDDFFQEYALPIVKNTEHGLYTRFDSDGWSVRITRPESAKKFLLKTNIFVKPNREVELKKTMVQRFIVGPNIVFLSGDAWKHQRMIANPAFHRSMPVDLFGKLTVKLFESIDSQGGLVDFRDEMERFTLDAIGKAGFGFDFNSLSDKNSKWVQVYDNIMSAVQDPLFFLFPTLDTSLLFLFPGRQKKHQELTEFLSMITSIIQSKREILKENKGLDIPDREKDLLTLLLDAENDDGQASLTDEELLSNICIFFLAGHDTTANALSFAAYYLAINQDIQKKAREEALRILGDDQKDIVPTPEQLKEMSYINTIIKEVLRIKGPVTSFTPRNTTEDTDLNGVFIPKGTRVNLDLYTLHHNPIVWKDPEVFDPDRFAPGGEAERAGLSWLPFGNGSRQCLGMNFSLAEQRVLLSMLLRKYEFSLPENSIHKGKVVVQYYPIITPKDLYLTLKKRY